MKKVIFVIIALVGLAGCSSMDKTRQVKLHGLIMDADGKGVSSYRIMKGEKQVGLSNDNGYFDVDAVYGDGVELVLQKKNWETVMFSEEKCDLTKLYVFKVRSVDSVCREIEEKLDARAFDKTESIFETLPEEMKNYPRIKYLRAVMLHNQGKYAQALEILKEDSITGLKESKIEDFIKMLEKKLEVNNG